MKNNYFIDMEDESNRKKQIRDVLTDVNRSENEKVNDIDTMFCTAFFAPTFLGILVIILMITIFGGYYLINRKQKQVSAHNIVEYYEHQNDSLQHYDRYSI